MRNAQIEKLRSLKQRLGERWKAHDGPMETATVAADLEELVEILLMEREGQIDEGFVLRERPLR